jgi:hypothetical protein
MSNRKIITAAAATGGTGNYSSVAVSDPYYNNVSLLLNGDVDVDDNFANVSLLLDGNTSTDKSNNKAAVTAYGNAAVTSVNKKFGTGSYYFDGTGDYLTIPKSDAFRFTSSNFTIEFWGYFNDISTGVIASLGQSGGSNSAFSVYYDTNQLSFYVGSNGASWDALVSSTFTLNTWTHFAIVRNGTSTTIYKNGLSSQSATSVNMFNDTVHDLVIGSQYTSAGILPNTGQDGNFYIDDLRITKGVARYTANFTPPVKALPTHEILDSSVYRLPITTTGNVNIDTSTKKFGNGSMFFNGITGGTNAYILLNNSNFALNTISFTIEGWFNCNVPSGSYGIVFALSTGYTGSTGISLFVYSNGQLNFWYNGTSVNATSTISFNTWYHFAYVKNGSNILCFLNGILLATTSNAFAQTSNNLTIGSTLGGTTWDTTYTAPMYIDDFRITNGIARYTAAFTPPSASLPTIPSTISSDPWWNDVVLLIDGNTTDAYDPYWQNTSLMLTGDDFIDWSNQHNAVTNNGSTPLSSSIKKYNSSSYDFSSTGRYLSMPTSSNFELLSNNFTIELWAYRTGNGTGDRFIIDKGNSQSFLLRWQAANSLQFYISSTNVLDYPNFAFTLATWYHIAVVRNGNLFTLYINGVSVTTGNSATSVLTTATNLAVCANSGSGGENFQGYLTDIRITKGIARYTANFTPPTAALPSYKIQDRTQNNLTLTPYGNVQLSTDVFKNGAGSMFFDGTEDSVVMGDSSQFTFGTGDFTIEAWVYITRVWGTHAIVSQRSDLQNELFFGFDPVNGCTLFMYCDGVSGISGGRYPHPTPMTLNAWHHVVAMRRSGVAYISLDGNIQTGVSFTRNLTSTHCCIGSDSVLSGTGVFSGYIDDLRITKGYTRYTQNFTPPSQSFATQYTSTVYDANYANVSLLLNGNGTNGSQVFTDLSSSPNIITAYGNAQISTSVKKFGTGSMYFDGNGDVLKTPPASAFTFGTGDFTVEGWFYQTTDNTYPSAFEINNHLGVGGILFITRYNGTACIYAADTGGGAFIAPQATTLNTWNHIAWVRNNSVLRTYVNGVSSSSNALTLNITATTSVTIGGEQSVTTGYCFPGYIDDFRVTKGIARYVTNFTPQNY